MIWAVSPPAPRTLAIAATPAISVHRSARHIRKSLMLADRRSDNPLTVFDFENQGFGKFSANYPNNGIIIFDFPPPKKSNIPTLFPSLKPQQTGPGGPTIRRT